MSWSTQATTVLMRGDQWLLLCMTLYNNIHRFFTFLVNYFKFTFTGLDVLTPSSINIGPAE